MRTTLTPTTMLLFSGCSTLVSNHDAPQDTNVPRVAQKADANGHYYFFKQIAERAQASFGIILMANY